MILIGQYDSPFVRRVGIALRLYGLAFDHLPLSVFGDATELSQLNPLMRVPVLQDGGLVLTDSHAILDYLDGLVPQPLYPKAGPERAQALRVASLATGLAEKAVTLLYMQSAEVLTAWTWKRRVQDQIDQGLAALEAECPEGWWSSQMTHADIAVACALRFLREVHGLRLPPRLAAFSARAEALPVFAEISQPFKAPT